MGFRGCTLSNENDIPIVKPQTELDCTGCIIVQDVWYRWAIFLHDAKCDRAKLTRNLGRDA